MLEKISDASPIHETLFFMLISFIIVTFLLLLYRIIKLALYHDAYHQGSKKLKIVFFTGLTIIMILTVTLFYGMDTESYKIKGDAKLVNYDSERDIATVKMKNHKPFNIDLQTSTLFGKGNKTNRIEMQALMEQPKPKRTIHIDKSTIDKQYLIPEQKDKNIYQFDGQMKIKDKVLRQKVINEYKNRKDGKLFP